MSMKLNKVPSRDILNWYESLIRHMHYCPMQCACLDHIPEEFRDCDELREEILERMEWHGDVKL